MLRLFRRDPLKKLEAEYAEKLKQARDAQRNGKMPLFARLSAESEAIGQRIDALRQAGSG